MVLNELISNNAAAALSFPFCLESARLLGVSERPFIMAVTLAASYAFASPIGYQTHMMVFGPGGYRFTDFMRVGIPLEPIDVHRRGRPDPADLAVRVWNSLTLLLLSSAILSIIPFQLEHPFLDHAFRLVSELLSS